LVEILDNMAFYKKAADILKALSQEKGTIKGLVLASDVKDTDKKRMFALVCETLKCKARSRSALERQNCQLQDALMTVDTSYIQTRTL
jgi:hypothetical protein